MLPGLALVFMEVSVMTAISVAISTRMPMLVNVTSCLAVFVIGHLTRFWSSRLCRMCRL